MLYYVYFSNAGLPATGLTDSKWESLRTAETGADRTSAANISAPITEVGGGWYKFRIKYGQSPWNTKTEDLVGVIKGNDAEGTLTDKADNYKPVVISLRGLALARIAHKGVQNRNTGQVTIYETDGTSESNKELVLDMTDNSESITRMPNNA